MKKRLISCVVLLVVAALLIGCTPAATTSPPPDSSTPATDAPASSAPASNAPTDPPAPGVPTGPQAKFDPPIDVSAAVVLPNPATQDYPAGDDANSNAWTRHLLGKYGINITFEWMANDGADYVTRISLALASGDTPDLYGVNAVQLSEVVDAGLVQPIRATYDAYKGENLANVLEVEGGEEVFTASTRNNELMAIPFTTNPKENGQLLFLRTDWMEALGLETPQTLEDVHAIAEAFASQDPDGNGVDDTYAVQMEKGIYAMVHALFQANGSYPGNYIKGTDGTLINSTLTENTRQVIAKLNEWSNQGWIDPEWFTKDYAIASEMINTGRVGILSGVFSTPLYPLQAGHDTGGYEWTTVPMPAAGGGLTKSIFSLGVSQYWVAAADFEYPGALILMLNEWVDIFYYNTDDEVHAQLNSSPSGAEIWQNAPFKAFRGLKNIQYALEITEYYESDGGIPLSDLTPEQRTYIGQIDRYHEGDESLWAWNKIFGVGGAASLEDAFIREDSLIFSEFWGSPTTTMVERGVVLDEMLTEAMTGFITGTKPLSEWDAFVAEYNTLGGTQVLEEVNAWYNGL